MRHQLITCLPSRTADSRGISCPRAILSTGSLCLAGLLFLAGVPVVAAPSTAVAPASLAAADSAFGAGTLRSALRLQEVYGAQHFPAEGLIIQELRFRPDFHYGNAFTSTVASIEI